MLTKTNSESFHFWSFGANLKWLKFKKPCKCKCHYKICHRSTCSLKGLRFSNECCTLSNQVSAYSPSTKLNDTHCPQFYFVLINHWYVFWISDNDANHILHGTFVLQTSKAGVLELFRRIENASCQTCSTVLIAWLKVPRTNWTAHGHNPSTTCTNIMKRALISGDIQNWQKNEVI